ncbi:dephospho-CoA kinase [Hamadaea flava]|uniref:Uridine kinase n=1 Tax=Hamadaea flava TaxID=1742688 RepID=A0ABV8LJJ5_9ACTN|nr:hypothetical protein [Hamadaea flava]MCP2323582.1 dephospho-CoA kinase [Hamadaea flava]
MTRPVLITGVSGSGKSALTRALIGSGQRAISLDAYPGLAYWADHTHTPVTRPHHPDIQWLTAHHWILDPQVLDQLITTDKLAGQTPPLVLCGVAANLADLRDRFSTVIMLDIDRATQADRLTNASRGNDFGRAGDSARWLTTTFDTERTRLMALADTIVDATGDLHHVTGTVIAVIGAGDASR